MKRLILFIALIPMIASAAPIFPPILAGEASVRIITPAIELDADGVPLNPPISSVALLADGVPVHCEPMGNSESKQVLYQVANNAIGRVEVVAQSYPNIDCTGIEGDPSTNTAYYFFVGPLPADLAP